jgi:hypothetical protein
MTGSEKRKGDQGEREAAALIRDLTGWPARRRLGAGRADDTGDIDGVPDTVVQVASWADTLRAAREKPTAAERQRVNAGASHAATFVRLRGGGFRVVLTPEQWAALARDALITGERP